MYGHSFLALLYMTVKCCAREHYLPVAAVDYCSYNCSKVIYIGFDGKSQFNDCMKQCTIHQGKSWPLNDTEICDYSPPTADSKNVCSAETAWIRKYNLPSSSAICQYLIVYWRPCAVALEYLQGYQIELVDTSVSGTYSACVRVSLTRNLTPNDSDTEFAVFFSDRHLKYNTNYNVAIYGFPRKHGNIAVTLNFHSNSCSSLNGFGSCVCGLAEYIPLPRPNITISGYLVRITIPPLDPCFSILRYELYIRSLNRNSSIDLPVPGIKTLHYLKRGHMTESFYPLYPKDNVNMPFDVKYRAIGYSLTLTHSDSEVIPIKVVQWMPCKPDIAAVGSDIIVTWCCAPAVYNISRYEMKLIHNNSEHTVFLVNSSCHNHQNMSKTILSLSPGAYSSQIREWRDPKYKSHAMWSAVSMTVESLTDELVKKNLVILAVTVIVFVTIVALVLTMLCYKKLCRKVQRIPDSVRNAIGGTNPDQTHVCKTVWVVWQADNKSNSVAAEVHSENIRHLASFLANHCGLNVILDQYEVTIAPSLSSWLKEKQKAADTVIFVCPHQTVSELDRSLNQLIGNFLSVYNLYESALLFESYSVKFASVLLPYSRPTFYAEAKMLLDKVPSFKLMDDIDNLYFFIQNRAKAGPYGRCVLEYVNRHDYSKTEEGTKLKVGFQKMMLILGGDGQSEVTSVQESMLTQESMLLSEQLQERQLDIRNIADQGNLQRSDEFEPLPPPPIQLQEDADHTVFMINTSDLLSQQPIESESIEVVTFDSNCPLLAPSPIATISL